MIDALIFSKERPCQLDLLLRSIERHAMPIYNSVTVLATARSVEALRGYSKLFATSFPWAALKWEDTFEDDTRFWLSRADDLVQFLVDDDVYYRAAPQPQEIPFSYRGGDYDYPLSVDGNVYHRDDIADVWREMPRGWRNPTQLEAIMHECRYLAPFTEVTPCVPPCLAGIPANVVSESSGMPHMGMDAQRLNEAYCAGMRISLDEVERELLAQRPAAHMRAGYVLR